MSEWTAIIPILLIAAVAYFVVSSKSKKGEDIVIPPAPRRAGLLYGYYACYGDQIAETRDHTNLYWEPCWGGTDGAIAQMAAAQQTTVLDVDKYIFVGERGRKQIAPNAESQLRELFDALRGGGVLHLVHIIVPRDEPNLEGDDVTAHLPAVVPLIWRVASDYPELAGVLMGVVYAGNLAMPSIELFDIVGFDDYDGRSGIFAPGGSYDQMRALMRPGQRTWIFPGGTYGQPPEPFLNFANGHHEVIAIVPFLWADIPWESFPGIRSLPAMKDAYTAVGQKVMSAA